MHVGTNPSIPTYIIIYMRRILRQVKFSLLTLKLVDRFRHP